MEPSVIYEVYSGGGLIRPKPDDQPVTRLRSYEEVQRYMERKMTAKGLLLGEHRRHGAPDTSCLLRGDTFEWQSLTTFSVGEAAGLPITWVRIVPATAPAP